MAYHVFLSFRGKDTRKTFGDHLYTALLGAGFRTFRDDDEIERGENVKLELDKAIKEARSSVIVFSKDYASSGWCLDELVMILERKRTSSGAGHFVLPVFYDVDPSQVRHQTGSYGEAFRIHEEQLNTETNENKKECLRKKVQTWREALTEVAGLGGKVLQNEDDGHEAKFIQEIVKVIEDKVERGDQSVARYLVGLEYRATNINSWIQDESTNVIAAIYGGGIGKTTIAKYVYYSNTRRFEASSFLENIREEVSKGPEGVVCLQRKLLSDILKRKMGKFEIGSVDRGNSVIKDVIRSKRVLVVLDDVDDQDLFDNLIEMHDWFHPGSKIILTTRNIRLLNKIDQRFEVVGLDSKESLELFSWHAFKRDHPIEGYTEHSERIVQHCEGLPLALEVLGAFLSNRSLEIWEEAIQKLVAIPRDKILEKLKISYDSLDDPEKQLFLHIACFFIGESVSFIVRILGVLYPKVGIQTLVERCLLTINWEKKLMMHQLLQQMGKEIVRQESPDEPGKRSRLWHHEDSFKVLSRNTGTKKIKGLFLDMNHLSEEPNRHVLEKDSRFLESICARNVKRPRSEELNHDSSFPEQGHSLKRRFLSSFIWHPTNKQGRSANQVETDAFTKMNNLILLKLNKLEIKGRYIDFPRGLKYLSCHGFPLTSIATEFPDTLVDLDLQSSKLERVLKGKKLLTSLKILNLSYSFSLKNTPVFTQVPNLEQLVLKHCISLVDVDESIGELRSLVLLNLECCKNLKKLPREVGNLTSLEKLILSGCSKLNQLPAELGQMKSLTKLLADGISQDVGEDGSWTSFVRSLVHKPRKSPKTLLCLPSSLVELRLSNCNLSSDGLENCLGSLSSLEMLDLSKNPISSIPESIKGLTKLWVLCLRHCKGLRSLPELPNYLGLLEVDGCSSLEIIQNLPNAPYTELRMEDANKLVDVGGMFKIEAVANADAEIINGLGLSSSELETIESLVMELSIPCGADRPATSLQVLHEFSIYSIFLHGGKVPAGWCCSNRTMGSRISFTMPSLPCLKIQALKIYVVLVDKLGSTSEGGYDYITVNNVSKGLKWAYTPMFMLCPSYDGDRMMVWLCHWKIGSHLTLEAGDEVNVSAGFYSDHLLVKEIGVQFVYDEPKEKGSQHQKAYSHNLNVINAIELSACELIPGYYHLCNYGDISSLFGCHRTTLKEHEKIMFGE